MSTAGEGVGDEAVTAFVDSDSIVDAILGAFPLPGSNKLTSLGVAWVADAVLDSDWLTAHDEAIRAEVREAVAAAIEAEREKAIAAEHHWRTALARNYTPTARRIALTDAAALARTTEEGA